MNNQQESKNIKLNNSDFTFLTNQKSWLKIPADGSPLTFTGNADEAAKEFFNALIRVRDGYISALKAERDAQQKRADALAVENAALKLSRETLAKNALETCNDVFSAGYHSPALHRGLMESTGNRNTYPNPISALVNEAVRELETPATDAALAAIRSDYMAEGAEIVARKAQVIYQERHKSGDFESAGKYLTTIKFANNIAADIREAK